VAHWFESPDEVPLFGRNVVLERSLGWARNRGKRTMAISNPSSSVRLSRKIRRRFGNPTYLQNIDTLPRDVTVDFVLFVEMPSEHLSGLINGVFDLHRDTATSLRLLDNLRADNQEFEPDKNL
jgi:hypothetical protein